MNEDLARIERKVDAVLAAMAVQGTEEEGDGTEALLDLLSSLTQAVAGMAVEIRLLRSTVSGLSHAPAAAPSLAA